MCQSGILRFDSIGLEYCIQPFHDACLIFSVILPEVKYPSYLLL